MHFIFLDSTAVADHGPGEPAHFSRPLIKRLVEQGHTATIHGDFDAHACAEADVVITEWCNELAFAAARSGACKRLVIRMRGYDVWGPLDKLAWENVDALVYESQFLQELVEQERLPALRGFRSHVIPSGVDLERFTFKKREPNNIVALVARATADKGYQLALEWARTRQDVSLHITTALGEQNPRLVRYLQHVKPANVTIHGDVDPATWLDEVDASYVLSTSIWETLGYSIAEGMAMGCKPLIHYAPGTATNWPGKWLWRGCDELDEHMVLPPRYGSSFDSHEYRAYVEQHLDAAKLSQQFIDLVLQLPARTPQPPDISYEMVGAQQALAANRFDIAEPLITEIRQRLPSGPAYGDDRAALALGLAQGYYRAGKLDEAAVWALRSLQDGARTPAMLLLGETEVERGHVEEGVHWYEAALALNPVPSRYTSTPLITNATLARFDALRAEAHPKLLPGKPSTRFLIVVPCRNAEKWINTCLTSIEAQYRGHTWPSTSPLLCVVIDDASTDKTPDEIDAFFRTLGPVRSRCFRVERRGQRRHSLWNISDAIRVHGKPGDVVVIVDGDDWLADSINGVNALQTLDVAYANGAWCTYGNFEVFPTGKPSWMAPYPIEVARAGAFRKFPWRCSHPKTFRVELFYRINPEDFQHEGKWFTTAGDVALMLPILEMACERAVYIPQQLYVYNMETPAQDHKTDPDLQVRVRDLIYAKKPYERLEEL